MTDKLKYNQRIGRMTFFVAWVVIAVIGSFIAQLIIGGIVRFFSTDVFSDLNKVTVSITVVILITELIVGYLQSIAIRRFWMIDIRHWWWVTGVGVAVGHLIDKIVTSNIFQLLPVQPGTATMVMMILVSAMLSSGIPALAQVHLLKPHLNHVKFYVLVVISSGFVISYGAPHLPQMPYLFAIFQGVCTSLVLLWLDHITYEHVDETQIAKVET